MPLIVELYIASDHAGYDLKEGLKAAAEALGVTFKDLGTHSNDSVHYPAIAQNFSKTILESGKDLENPCGVLICGSGIGVSIGANRFSKIRAALSWQPEIATLARQHNNANVLCLPARFISEEVAIEIIEAWLSAGFEGGRHQDRVAMLEDCK